MAISSPPFISISFSKSVWFILCTTFTVKQADLQLCIIQHTNSQQLSLLLLMLGWDNSMNITIPCPYSTNFFTFHFSSYAVQPDFFCLQNSLLPPNSFLLQTNRISNYFPVISKYSRLHHILSHSTDSLSTSIPPHISICRTAKLTFVREKIMYTSSFCLLLLNIFKLILSTLSLSSNKVSYSAYTLESREVG